jgi:multidrug resistance protein, MATE family
MEQHVTPPALASSLPALKLDAQGQRRVDLRTVIALALPLVLNSSLQATLSLTDTWFIGRISPDATAAMGAVYWFVIVSVVLLGGMAMGVQTLVAQAFGARRRARAARLAWASLWATLAVAPIFWLVAAAGHWIVPRLGLTSAIEGFALEFWVPRMLGGALSVAPWALAGFFSGIGRTTLTLAVTALIAILNVPLNELFIFHFGWGMAGAAWATNAALLVGVGTGLAIFLSAPFRAQFKSHLTWRPEQQTLRRVFALGIPVGALTAAELIGLALFQLMQTQIGALDGAATLIVVMLTSICYWPAIGIAMTGTTLIGQSIGAKDRAWALKLGNTIIALAVGYIGVMGLLLALCGPWLAPLFVNAQDPRAVEIAALTAKLLWIAAAYQVFDGLNIGSGFCLRGAGDVKVPTLLLIALSWFVWVPLAHSFSFASGQGWWTILPRFGWGATGGWVAAVIYTLALGLTLFWRWRSRAWQRISL